MAGGVGKAIGQAALPVGAGLISSLGHHQARGVQTALGALQTGRDERRKQRLGERIAGLADSAQDEQLAVEQESYHAAKPEVTQRVERPPAMPMVGPGGIDLSHVAKAVGSKTVGKAVDKRNVEADASQERLSDFLGKVPEPQRDSFYQQIGAMAMEGNVDMAMQMLGNRQQLISKLRLDQVANAREDANLEANREVRREQIAATADSAAATRELQASMADQQREFQRTEGVANRDTRLSTARIGAEATVRGQEAAGERAAEKTGATAAAAKLKAQERSLEKAQSEVQAANDAYDSMFRIPNFPDPYNDEHTALKKRNIDRIHAANKTYGDLLKKYDIEPGDAPGDVTLGGENVTTITMAELAGP